MAPIIIDDRVFLGSRASL